MQLYTALLYNASLLLSLVVFYSLLLRHLDAASLRGRLAIGALFGLAAIIGMLLPAQVRPGLFFDGRSIAISMAGVFGGAAGAAAAALPALAFRAWLGGAGVLVGGLVIGVTALLGGIYHHLWSGGRITPNAASFLGLGVVVHLAVLACQWPLPEPLRGDVYAFIAPAMLMVFPPATVLIGLLLQRAQQQLVTEQQLRDSEARLRLAVQAANVGLWDWDLKTHKVLFSPEWKRQIGYEDGEIGDSFEEWRSRVHPDDLERAQSTAMAFVENPWPNYHSTFRFRHRDGSYRWILTQASLVTNSRGKAVRMIGSHVDVTELRQANQALVESEQRFQRALDHIPDVVVLYDADLTIQYINAATRALTGYPSSHYIGRRDEELWPPEVYQAYLPTLRQALETRTVRSVETQLTFPGDGAKFLHITCVPVLDERGETREVLGITRDFTEVRRAEAEIRQLNVELEQRVAERTRALTEANAKLQELDRLKSLFIASMSHELRTPLNSVIGFSGLLLQELAGPINDKQRDYCTRILVSGRHLLDLITDVIDISKIEAGKVQATPEALELGALLREVVAQLRPEAEGKGLLLDLAPLDSLSMYSDRRRLMQCVINLLTNAVKYTERGRIDISAEAAGSAVEITVADTGTGIAAEEMPKLFQQFSRIDTPLTRSILGTGLGLYLTRKLAREILGGDVAVSSRPGEGSRFTLRVARELIDGNSAGHRG
jgi:PAS domain S-box-containing protein